MKLTKELMEKIPNLPKDQVIGIFEKYLGPLTPEIKNTNFNYIDTATNTISFDFVLNNINILVSMPANLFVCLCER